MVKGYSWHRLKQFCKRNDIIFYISGLIIVTHVAWWEIQQNRAFVKPKDRQRHIGPFNIPYLDESESFKNYYKKIRSYISEK